MATEDALKKINEDLGALREQLVELTDRLTKAEEKLDQFVRRVSDATQNDLTSARIAVYNSLSGSISSRRTQHMTVNGFLVTGATLALTFAVGTTSSSTIRGLVSLIAVLLVSVAWINWRGLRVVDEKTYNRIHEIEGPSELNVSGHAGIKTNIEKDWHYMARDAVWDFFYGIVLGASVLTSIHLFLPGVLPTVGHYLLCGVFGFLSSC